MAKTSGRGESALNVSMGGDLSGRRQPGSLSGNSKGTARFMIYKLLTYIRHEAMILTWIRDKCTPSEQWRAGLA
jgi:hypothetical protein